MSEIETCPFCRQKAGTRTRRYDELAYSVGDDLMTVYKSRYPCGVLVERYKARGQQARTHKCYEREITALKEQLVTHGLAIELLEEVGLALEADVKRLEEDAADAQQVHEEILTEPCDGPNEWHCSCVPHLRQEVERLRYIISQTKTHIGLIECPQCGHLHAVRHRCWECGYDRTAPREDGPDE